MQDKSTSPRPWIVWGQTDKVMVEREDEAITIVAPITVGLTAVKVLELAEPLLSDDERRSFREVFGL